MNDFKKITEEMYNALKKPLPSEAVKAHPTKTFLSSIKAIYVTERLNDVFGCGSWRLKTEHITTTEKSMVVVKVTLEIPEYGVYYESFGGNDNGGENSKNFDLGDAYKGATTDAITKIGSYLGIAIDVFKGKNTPSQNQNTSNKSKSNDNSASPEKWLNVDSDEWKALVKSTESGATFTLAQIRKKYKVSNDTAKSLETLNIF